jgi:hypothetical protein
MRFCYFLLKGESLEFFLEKEKQEIEQRHRQWEVLMGSDLNIEEFSVSRTGKIVAIKFKPGKQPNGFVHAGRSFSKRYVRPSMRGKDAAKWRELIERLNVTDDCMTAIRTKCGLPTFVIDSHTMNAYNSIVGHVGGEVFVEVPYATDGNAGFIGHPDLEPVESWEFEKAYSEAKDYKYDSCFRLTSRIQ